MVDSSRSTTLIPKKANPSIRVTPRTICSLRKSATAIVLWTSGDFYVVGWLDTEKYLELRANNDPNAARDSQGWCPVVLDHNGDGTLGAYTGPFEPLDPTKDAQQYGFAYGIIPNPADGSVGYTQP